MSIVRRNTVEVQPVVQPLLDAHGPLTDTCNGFNLSLDVPGPAGASDESERAEGAELPGASGEPAPTAIEERRAERGSFSPEGSSGAPVSRQKFERYFSLRQAAGEIDKIDGEELAGVQESVRLWISEFFPDFNEPGSVDDYRTYSEAEVHRKIGGLVDYLRREHGYKVTEVELQATAAFIESSFSMYEDSEKGAALGDRDGSFAFVVPARMSRNYPMYGEEVEPVIPALRYVPNELRAWIMRGCPPFVIDTYQPGPDGKRGYLIYAPVTEDMRVDLSAESNSLFVGAAQDAVNDAVSLAYNRLGAEVVGLGATLPAVTFLGKTVRNHFGDQVIVTTGHGGTVKLICDTIDANTDKTPESVGVLGLGAIGASAAVIASEKYRNSKIVVYDPRRGSVNKLTEAHPGRFTVAQDEASLIASSKVVISAIAASNALDLDGLNVGSMEGVLVVDDSQPASMDPRQVLSRGGRYLWVIGQDTEGEVRRNGYDYGTMLSGITNLFGCEAEAAGLAAYYRDLQKQGRSSERARRVVGRLAVTGPVTALKAMLIGRLFERYGITASDPQAFGRPA